MDLYVNDRRTRLKRGIVLAGTGLLTVAFLTHLVFWSGVFFRSEIRSIQMLRPVSDLIGAYWPYAIFNIGLCLAVLAEVVFMCLLAWLGAGRVPIRLSSGRWLIAGIAAMLCLSGCLDGIGPGLGRTYKIALIFLIFGTPAILTVAGVLWAGEVWAAVKRSVWVWGVVVGVESVLVGLNIVVFGSDALKHIFKAIGWWFAFYPVAALIGWLIFLLATKGRCSRLREEFRNQGLCRACGYDLTGTMTGGTAACPECGAGLTQKQLEIIAGKQAESGMERNAGDA